MPCSYLPAPRCGLIDKMIEPKVFKLKKKQQNKYARILTYSSEYGVGNCVDH